MNVFVFLGLLISSCMCATGCALFGAPPSPDRRSPLFVEVQTKGVTKGSISVPFREGISGMSLSKRFAESVQGEIRIYSKYVMPRGRYVVIGNLKRNGHLYFVYEIPETPLSQPTPWLKPDLITDTPYAADVLMDKTIDQLRPAQDADVPFIRARFLHRNQR